MASSSKEDDRLYKVVVNDEEQYSVWLADRPLPAGWRSLDQTGSMDACLDYIEKHWTDMRPLSVRRALSQK
jgi:MbtH protein